MRTLEEQINILSNGITRLNFKRILEPKEKYWMEIKQRKQLDKEYKELISDASDILESLLILNDRDCLCDNCVNNYFEQITKES